MKQWLVAFLFLSSATISHAGGCRTEPISTHLPGFNWEEVKAKVERVFPTFRDVVLSSDSLALLWIDPKDCQAEDLEVRHQQIEAVLGRHVILMPSSVDYRILPGGFGYPQIVKTRQLKEIFPTLRILGSKIGENTEILVVSAVELSAPDLKDRLSRAREIVGRPVELRSSDNDQNPQ